MKIAKLMRQLALSAVICLLTNNHLRELHMYALPIVLTLCDLRVVFHDRVMIGLGYVVGLLSVCDGSVL